MLAENSKNLRSVDTLLGFFRADMTLEQLLDDLEESQKTILEQCFKDIIEHPNFNVLDKVKAIKELKFHEVRYSDQQMD